MSKPLYELFGFVAAAKERIDFDGYGDGGEEWHELARTCLPFDYWPMWRPIKGDYGGDKLFRLHGWKPRNIQWRGIRDSRIVPSAPHALGQIGLLDRILMC